MPKQPQPSAFPWALANGDLDVYHAIHNPGTVNYDTLVKLHQAGRIDDKTWNRNMTALGINDQYIY